MDEARERNRDKLGVALAGGGFRASLFHLGVLWRLAELDLLRHVQVLSTVSGGSIIGALYMLVLKKHLDKNENLPPEEYLEIMCEVKYYLLAGIRKNLRTRLFMNPFKVFRIIAFPETLSQHMARMYERHIYKPVVEELRLQHHFPPRPGAMRLKDLNVNPAGKTVSIGIDTYNHQAVEDGRSAITKLVLNATSLNSGRPFCFTSSEIGDNLLGYFRNDEEITEELLPRKELLHKYSIEVLQKKLDQYQGNDKIIIGNHGFEPETVSLTLWWREGKQTAQGKAPRHWTPLFDYDGFPGLLPGIEFGVLRRMKISAWCILHGMNRTPAIDCGMTGKEHMDVFWAAMRQVEEELAEKLIPLLDDPRQISLRDLFLRFILELYLLRSAEVMAENIKADWDNLTLGDAVGASACFPPVFPPFQILGFYDDWHVTRLGLTDGGVYDNIGLAPLVEENCNWLIVSDTSGLFNKDQKVSAGRIGMLARIVGILMNDVAQKQQEMLRTRRRLSNIMEIASTASPQKPLVQAPELQEYVDQMRACYETYGLAFFHINSVPIQEPDLKPIPDELKLLIANLRTDLDGFGEVEIAALVNHGHDMADRYLRKYFDKWPHKDPLRWKPAAKRPIKTCNLGTREMDILKIGQSRFFRALKLNAPVSWIITLFMVGVSIFLTRDLEISVRQLVEGAAQWIVAALQYPLALVFSDWTERTVSVAALITIVALSVSLYLLAKKWCEKHQVGCIPWIRFLSTQKKHALGLSGHAYWLGSIALTILACVGISLVAIMSHVFFYLPFRGKTRLRKDTRL